MSSLKIAVIGECMIELKGQVFGDMQQHFGGDVMNTAIYLKKLAADTMDVSFVSSMGTDTLSIALIDRWLSHGILVDKVLLNPHKNAGLYLIQNTPDGERTFQYWRNDSAAKYMVQHLQFNSVIDDLAKFDAIYLSGISLAILPSEDAQYLLLKLKRLTQKGVKLIFDSNYRPSLWSSKQACQQRMKAVMAMSSLALVTFEDEQLLWGDKSLSFARQRLHQQGASLLVIKDGANGCHISHQNSSGIIETQHYPTEPVTHVVDTTAAGDSFNAGFLCYWLQGEPFANCALAGNFTAAQVIAQTGAIVEIDPKKIYIGSHVAENDTLLPI
ncbi:sugar kinase [Shewanella sp. UCD-KL21]|uniref:sugar kinase n=1 Tax=Shewanella sp. UCD-KL21 TaxID=1917164 RepID=UPI000970309B|nr:sugar kinase [Shewanella sp. UCD-KL21]